MKEKLLPLPLELQELIHEYSRRLFFRDLSRRMEKLFIPVQGDPIEGVAQTFGRFMHSWRIYSIFDKVVYSHMFLDCEKGTDKTTMEYLPNEITHPRPE